MQARRQPTLPEVKSASGQPGVTVVVLSRNRLHLTRRCLESLYADADYPFELLIHDDGSQPETLAYLREQQAARDNLTLVRHPSPLGVAAARNLAFSLARTDYVFSMDNDMICHPGWLRETMACAVRHRAAFVVPLRLNVVGTVWAFAAELVRHENDTILEIARWFHDLPLSTVQSLFGENDPVTNLVPGGAGLYSTAAYQACGGFDEGYGGAFEDLDFSLKLAARGYEVMATARAVLTHDDEWLPQVDADREYARARYDPEMLRRAAGHFRARWGVEVLPDKYVVSLRRRLERKLAHGH